MWVRETSPGESEQWWYVLRSFLFILSWKLNFIFVAENCLVKMSIHWTLIAGFLYAEIGVILLLLVPFISTRLPHLLLYLFWRIFLFRMWNKVFKSRFLRGLESQLIYYFYVLVSNLYSSLLQGNAEVISLKLNQLLVNSIFFVKICIFRTVFLR